MQDGRFARNFNSPLTNLNDPVIIQVHPFDSPVIGVPMRVFMASSVEGMSTPTSTIPYGGVHVPPIGTFRLSTLVTPLSPSSRVVQPHTSPNVASPSSEVVNGIPSAPFASPSFVHTAQSDHVGFSLFVQGFQWNGGNIPPSTPYVGPTPAYVGVHFGNTNFYGQGFQTLISAPFTSSPFSFFGGGIPAPIFQTPVSTRGAQNTYTTLHRGNSLAYGWIHFQCNPTTL